MLLTQDKRECPLTLTAIKVTSTKNKIHLMSLNGRKKLQFILKNVPIKS